jgi:pimeloyl-ACP methyl ester carboxylesterase
MVPRDDPGEIHNVIAGFDFGEYSPIHGVITAGLVWGGFFALFTAHGSLSRFERNAILLACVLAVLAAGIAVQLYRSDRPTVLVFLASPFIVVAVSLPAVVAVLLVGRYPEIPVSTLPTVVAFLELTLLDPVGLARPFANTLHREGVGYTISWLLYSVPLGWLLGSAIVQVRFLAGANI